MFYYKTVNASAKGRKVAQPADGKQIQVKAGIYFFKNLYPTIFE